MAVYSSAAALALRMITAKGKLTTFSRISGENIDPVTQSGPGVATTYDARAVAFPLSATQAAKIFGVGAQAIVKPRLDVHIALSGVDETPQAGDRFAWGSQTYALLGVEALDPNGDGAFYAHGYAEAA